MCIRDRFNSIIIVTQSLDEEKWVNRVTRTDFNVYNSAACNVMESVQHHKDTLSQQAVDLIAGQPGVEDGRYLYRNTKDDRNVLVDYGFEDLSGIELFHEEEGIVNQSYQGYKMCIRDRCRYQLRNCSGDRCTGNPHVESVNKKRV